VIPSVVPGTGNRPDIATVVPPSIRRALAGVGHGAIERTIRRSGLALGLSVVYHGVAARNGDPRRELTPAHGEALLESQLRFLKERYRVVRASELPDAVNLRRRGERLPVAITFDDDLRSHVERAREALLRHRLPAAFFLSGASLDRPYAFWWDRLQRAFDRGCQDLVALPGEARSAMTIHSLGARIEELDPADRARLADRLGELVGPDPPEAGLRRHEVVALKHPQIEIGFHTLRHDPLPPLDDAALDEALTAGREELEDLVGERLEMVAYPHGQADARVAEAARAAGYAIGFTTTDAAIGSDSDPLLLGRFAPSVVSQSDFAVQISKILVRGAMHAWSS
jgi:peptidoglycan/xylan/chitin deacetylase (PgdA/CDA1 family)